MGRPVENAAERELMIRVGRDGYVALYRYQDNEVVILAIRHGREAGYGEPEQGAEPE